MEERSIEVDSALERLIFLSDGVFAIAMTLLALEIAVPALPKVFQQQEAKLPGALLGLLPQIATYVLSFIIVSVYWMTHQRLFQYIIRANSVLMWLNALFLMSVAFLPVPTKVLGQYGGQGAAVRFYAVSLMFTGLLNVLLWWYATQHHRLVRKNLDEGVIRQHLERSLIAPAVFLLAIALSYLNPYLATESLLLIGVAIVVHDRLYQRRIARQQHEPAPHVDGPDDSAQA